jgi:Tol biopolymer transport system component
VVGSNRAPDFSPDGKFLYFQTTSDPISSRWDFDPPALIKSISLESSEEKAVTNSEFMPMGLMTRLSPNGKMLLTTGTGTDGSGLYRIDLETDQSSQIVRNLENNFVRPFEWSSDEARVFCLFNTGGEIIQKEIATGIEKKIFDGVSNFAVSRDAKSMVVTKSDIKKGDTSLILVNLENGQSRQLLRVKMPEFIPVYTWTPDGKYLLFAKSRRDLIDEPHEIWKISIPEGRVEDLHIKSEYVTDIRVHPDNHRIIIAGQVDSSEIWVMENFL